MPFEFESPWVLFLLLLAGLVLLVLRYTLADSSKLQLAASALTRVIIVTLLVLAIAGTLWLGSSTEVAVLVLADVSDSTPDAAPKAVTEFLSSLQAEAPLGSNAGLVIFANDTQTVTPLGPAPKFPETLPALERGDDTSIEKALVLAREIMPPDSVNRVVLFSDGNETRGDALAAAKRAALHGIRVYTIPYTATDRPEVLLEDLGVPFEVKQGQSFAIAAVAHSGRATTASFSLYRNGFKIAERDMELVPGANTIRFDEPNPPDGLTKYELRVTAEEDYFADNNISSGTVFVSGEPRILLLEADEREARYLSRALEAENIRVEIREGQGMPGTLEELAAFDAVILSDVPATALNVRQMNLLRSYIEDLGGGFIMVGGEESFGLGGYYRTAIEDALPVRMRSEKKKDTPSLAMMLVIDKSGSMNGLKMDLAKEAAVATVELLGPRDYVGVVAFDGAAYWAVDLQSASNKMGIVQTIETIQAGGGTNIYPGLEEAYQALSQVAATFKHCILLTDGHSTQGDYAGVIDRMVNEQITVSSVGVGQGADAALLEDIARWGRGRYYFTADPYDIPQIFAKETMTASKSSLVEEPFLAQVFRSHQVIQSIDWGSAPFLFGYVVVMPKPTAEVLLVTERGDPLLTMWQYGLGKTVAFTSDAKSRWASDWLSWPGFGSFWAQVIRDAMRTSATRGSETSVVYQGDSARIIIDNVDENGNFINALHSEVQVIQPNLSSHAVALEQTAPGRYEASVSMEDTGSYLFRVRQAFTSDGDETEDQVVSDYTRGFTVSYKPEYRHLSTNEAFLAQLADVSGGSVNPSIEKLLAVTPEEAVPVRNSLWPWFLAAALILFVLDVALRRLDLAGWGMFGSPQRYG